MRGHNDQPPNAACASPTRRTEGLSNRITFSFGPPPPLVLRRPKKGPRLPAPRREESWCAGERQKARHIRAFHGKKGIGGPPTDKNLEGEGADGDLRLRVIIWESENPKRIGTRDSLLDNVKGNATLLDLQAVFAASTLLFSDLSEHFFEKSS